MSIQSRIISLTARQLGLGEDEISLDSNFMDDLGADSLDTVELVMNIEEEFEIKQRKRSIVVKFKKSDIEFETKKTSK